MIETILRERIVESENFQALAGSRIFPVLLPKTDFPAATYQRISTVALYTFDGRVGYNRIRFQFDAWALHYMEAKNLMAAISQAIDCYSDTLSDGSQIFSVQLVNSNDSFESGARIYRVTADYLVQTTLK